MEKKSIKVESGIQLLSRLSTKKFNVENFYPGLFEVAPKPEDVIEIFSNTSSSFLLIDMICDALIPIKYGGAEAGVLILNTDGHITVQALTEHLNEKLKTRIKLNMNEQNQILTELCKNLFILDVFDALQLYTTLQNLENILIRHSIISFCIIDTLTAFYWSEQSFKITKMDSYLKSVLQMVQKSTKGHEIITIYTRPEYFNSSKDAIENPEACFANPMTERVNFRINLKCSDYEAEMCTANVRSFNNYSTKYFRIEHNKIIWLNPRC